MEPYDTELQLSNANNDADLTDQINDVKPGDFIDKQILGNQIVDSNIMNNLETNVS